MEFAATQEGYWFRRTSRLLWGNKDLTSFIAWPPHCPVEESEEFDGRPWLMLAVWGHLSLRGGAFLHGGTCYCAGRHILLLGSSGAGKSTLGRLISNNGGTCLTDENPFVRGFDDQITAYGSPWSGIWGPPAPLSGPLAAVFFPRHGAADEAIRLTPQEAGIRLVANTRFFPWAPESTPKIMGLLDRIATEIPCFDFPFVPTPAAALLVERTVEALP